ncbi:FtsK/SpoIIIE domain-containing protein [Nocardia brasiliensis]|uniref:FtsK/SpoIIIE domain-containing protein n=1 Tax=Nocardia brasiliensis TaxID=37326 RepID=UPI002457B2A9|nr:FtsK/SpoIIIE domain-containing protein [Nocardia brasiliensis]
MGDGANLFHAVIYAAGSMQGKNKSGLGTALLWMLGVGVGWVAILISGALFGWIGLAVPVVFIALVLILIFGLRANRAAVERAAAAEREARYQAWLAHFPASLHHAMSRLTTPWSAAQMWASLGLGREPRVIGSGENARYDPGAWPTLIAWPDPPPPQQPDLGAWNTDIGVRVRLRMIDGQEPGHFAARTRALAAALDIPGPPNRQPNVRIADGDGHQLVLDLRCFDPLAGMNVSPLLDADTAQRVKWAVGEAKTPAQESELLTWAVQGMRLTVGVNSLSCTDDIVVGISEYGEWVVINLAAGIHGVVQGATRSGKSITLNTLLACAALMRDVRVCIIDPNTALVAPWWRTAHKVCRSSKAADATRVLEEVIAELKARESVFWAARTDRITAFSPEQPLYLLVIDEVAAYSDDKEFQATLKECSAQLAKYGGRLYLAGQKIDEKALDTGTRANLSDAICHRVKTDADFRHLFPDATELIAAGLNAADRTMPQGVAITHVKSQKEPGRMRSVYLPTEACWAIADAVVAVRGEVRPLPGTRKPAVTAGDTPAITGPDAAEATGTERPRRSYPTLPPKVAQLNKGRTVIPFDRDARTDQPGPGPDQPNTGTGTQ